MIDHQVVELVSSGISTGVIAALAFIGRQFQKNRRTGRERDKLVGALEAVIERQNVQIQALTSKVEGLTREVDHDRMETRFVQEALRGVEREMFRAYAGSGEPPTGPGMKLPPPKKP